MNAPIRLVDTGLASARRNIAITAALAEMHSDGRIPDTLRFHVYPRSVLVGRHQNLDGVADVSYCSRVGIEIARRVTGGGAVYMNADILAWDMVVGRARWGGRVTDVMQSVCTGLAVGLARLGLPACFRPLNDIEISGYKIAGSSGLFLGPTLLAQGTVLLDFNIEEMARALVLPANASLEAGRSHLADRVSSLAAFLGHPPDSSEIKRLLTAGLAQNLRLSFVESELSKAEKDYSTHLHQTEFGAEDFVRGGAPELSATGKPMSP